MAEYCANCGNYIDGHYSGCWSGGIHFCSGSCANAFEAKTRASSPQVIVESGPDYSGEISSMQNELNALRQEQARRQQEEKQRRREEEQRRQEQERKEREEKARQEKLGKCAWCGRQNEQIFANQLLFPGRKFCSKKCLFDCRSAENPAEPAADTPRITMQPSGNIYTSIKDAVDDAPDGETLLFSNGVFEVNETIEVDKTLTFKATNSDMNSGLSERTVFKMHDINSLQPWEEDKATIDGIVFEGMDKEKSRGLWAGCDELVIKNCVFMTLHHAIEFIGNNIKIENCLFINCTWAFRQNHSFFEDSDYIKDCTFDSVKYIFEEKSCDCLENCTIKNSLLSPHYDVPSNNAQSYNERSKKTYGCLQTAIDEAVSGDTIVLAPGTQYEGFCLEGKSDITIKASVINTQAPDPQQSVVSVDSNVFITDCKGITFEGISFKNLAYWSFRIRDSECIGFNSCEFFTTKNYDGSNFTFNPDDKCVFNSCVFNDFVSVFEDYKVQNTGCSFNNCDVVYGSGNVVYLPVKQNCLSDGRTTMSFGAETVGGAYSKVIYLDSSSTSGSGCFTTSCDNQVGVTLSVFGATSDDATKVSECLPLGSYDFLGFSPAPKGKEYRYEIMLVENHWLKLCVSSGDDKLRARRNVAKETEMFASAAKSGPKFCKKCGAALVSGKKFCTKCGAKA